MRKRTSILLAMSALLTLIAVLGAGATPAYVTTQTVRYSCIASPDMRGHVEGQWVTDCSGNTTGWGWEPGHNCTETETTYGAACGGGGGSGDPFNPGVGS